MLVIKTFKTLQNVSIVSHKQKNFYYLLNYRAKMRSSSGKIFEPD